MSWRETKNPQSLVPSRLHAQLLCLKHGQKEVSWWQLWFFWFGFGLFGVFFFVFSPHMKTEQAAQPSNTLSPAVQ